MKSTIKVIIFTILIIVLIALTGLTERKFLNPQEVYQVYLNGQKIGLINDDQELYDLIDSEGDAIKEKYDVTQVYPPNGLDVKKHITYKNNVVSVEQIYSQIKEREPFTIDAYKITIKSENKMQEIYTLTEDVFKKSLYDFLYVFIPEEEYNAYIKDQQLEITDTGELIETVYFNEKITVKHTHISTENKIFTDSDELSQYLLFGTTEKQKTYVVKAGEDVESIAYNNKLNAEEFLIANPTFTSVNQLLSPGQIVNVGLINPMINVTYEMHVVDDEESVYDTETEYDPTLTTGTRYVKQEGENGIDRITKKVIMKNGEIQEAFIASSVEIKPAVSKIIVRGSKVIGAINDNDEWRWPTNRPYTITSYYGWRWGEMHRAVDISGKHGSPIYAAASGVVTFAGRQSRGGLVVYIDHQNGYFTEYAHMSKLYVSVGQYVESGATIAAMGKTGEATGTHLHYGMWSGKPWSGGSYAFDPLTMYR